MIIDEAAFALIEKRRKFDDITLEIGKRRILNNEGAADLAAAYGKSKGRVYAIETQIRGVFQAMRLPPGWAEVTLIAPKELIQEFERKAQNARDQLTKPRPRAR